LKDGPFLQQKVLTEFSNPAYIREARLPRFDSLGYPCQGIKKKKKKER
jgi:hypothetical protein